MRIDVLTLFPEMFDGVFHSSILGKAAEKQIVHLNAINFRQYAGTSIVRWMIRHMAVGAGWC